MRRIGMNSALHSSLNMTRRVVPTSQKVDFTGVAVALEGERRSAGGTISYRLQSYDKFLDLANL